MIRLKIILDILSKVKYDVDIKGSIPFVGTKPNPSKGYPHSINNVKDAFSFLLDGVKKGLIEGLNDMPHFTKKSRNGHLRFTQKV